MDKKIVAVIVCTVLIAAGIGGVILYNSLQSKGGVDLSDWNEAAIKDFANYKYVGAGAASDFSSTDSNIIHFGAEADTSKDMKLMGITNENTCEPIKYTNSSGNVIEHDVNLAFFYSMGDVCLVCYTEENKFYNLAEGDMLMNFVLRLNSNGGFETNINTLPAGMMANSNLIYLKSPHLFIMDNKTGHIYYVNDIVKKLKDDVEGSFDYYELRITDSSYNKGVFYPAFNYGNGSGPANADYSLLKMKIENDSMKVEMIMNNEQVENIRASYSMTDDITGVVDIYGNIVIGGVNYIKTGSLFHDRNSAIMSSSYKFTTMKDADENYDENLKYVYHYWGNGVIYVYASTGLTYVDNIVSAKDPITYCGYLDENCKFIQIADQGQINGKVLKGGNNEYYRIDWNETELLCKKITVDPEKPWKYTVDTKVIGNSYSTDQKKNLYNNSYFYKGHIYSYSGDIVYDYDFSTNTMDSYDCGVTIKKLYLDHNLDIVKLDCTVKSTMKDTSGYLDINKAGSEKLVMEEYILTYGPSRIYVIAPVN